MEKLPRQGKTLSFVSAIKEETDRKELPQEVQAWRGQPPHPLRPLEIATQQYTTKY